ncbi:MAG TPA: RluA family pseudouridine synthase [Pirellulales bacterium]|jgi:RluA family pseudouridine synthase|nr:RluA family pseudouridine synthase [Pirellulales bacterium]
MSSPHILYHDGPCIVAFKPGGLLTQAPPGIDSMEARMKDWLRATEGKTGNVYLGIPQRLDRPVSGAIVFARHVRAARRLSEQFERRTVRKVYWACVSGTVEPSEGTWTDWLLKIVGQPRAMVVNADTPDARQAVLRYRRLGTFAWGSWLEIELLTGRNHQIRVQTSSRGHLVLGDTLYGSIEPFGPPYDDQREQHIALHARRLEFLHPMTRAPVEVTAPLPAAWRRLGLPLADADYGDE